MTGFGIVLVALHALAASASRGPTVSAKKACAPRLNKTSMLQRSAMARSLAQAKRPDPTCKTGVVSLAGAVADRPQACCPAYCGECSDYPECDKVRGQDSANACCLSKVLDLECGGPGKPPANVCLKKCVDAVPPCIMEEGVAFEMPSVTSAAEDCNEAVGEWMDKAESAVKSGKGGAASWDSLEAAGKIYELAQNSSKKTTVTPKKCSPRLNKTSMLQRSTLFKSFVAAKRPDPTCKTGVVSLAGAVADRPQACCPAYCGECSDYPECDKVRGQDSANACCLSKVLDLECGGPAKPPANVCLKKCVDAVPPCIMEEGVAFEMPSVTSAAEDCNEAVGEWMDKAESAVKSGKGGAASWDALETAGTIYELAQNSSKKTTVTPKKKCAPRLNKTSMLQRSTLFKSFVSAKKPDPTCKTGVVSLAGAVADRPQACCPAYCGECSDYPECDKVRGQDSANACCLSKVLDLECGGPAKPPANVCLKKCVDAVPPCIMAEGETFEMPGVTSAAEDCNEAVGEWMDKAESAVKSGKGGAASWDALETAGTIYELAQNSSKKTTVTPAKNTTKKCAPKLSKAAMLQRATLFRSFSAAKKPDPTCKTGVVSLAGAVADRPQACCPAYCGECSDYPECDKVRGQDSANACCLSKVLDLECGGPAKPAANVCLKKCVDAVPPCIMEEGVAFEMPSVTSAAEDCNEAVGEWMDKAESAVKSGKGGAASWDALETAGTIYELRQKSSNKTTVQPKK